MFVLVWVWQRRFASWQNADWWYESSSSEKQTWNGLSHLFNPHTKQHALFTQAGYTYLDASKQFLKTKILRLMELQVIKHEWSLRRHQACVTTHESRLASTVIEPPFRLSSFFQIDQCTLAWPVDLFWNQNLCKLESLIKGLAPELMFRSHHLSSLCTQLPRCGLWGLYLCSVHNQSGQQTWPSMCLIHNRVRGTNNARNLRNLKRAFVELNKFLPLGWSRFWGGCVQQILEVQICTKAEKEDTRMWCINFPANVLLLSMKRFCHHKRQLIHLTSHNGVSHKLEATDISRRWCKSGFCKQWDS